MKDHIDAEEYVLFISVSTLISIHEFWISVDVISVEASRMFCQIRLKARLG